MNKKKHSISIIISLLFISVIGFAQNGFNYQASLRKIDGSPIADSSFVLGIDILRNTINGTVIYSETHNVTTNSLGLIQLVIGTGNSNHNFNAISWENNKHFIALNINGQVFSVSELLSVPYAMHAFSAGKLSSVTEPTEKSYTDSLYTNVDKKVNTLAKSIKDFNQVPKSYVDSLANGLLGFDATVSGDTLQVGNNKMIIPGVSAKNKKPYNTQHCFGGNGNELVKAVLESDSGNYIVIAETNSRNGDIKSYYGSNDIWIFEVTPTLKINWQTTIGGSAYDNFSMAKTLPNGNLLLTGTTESGNGSFTKNQGKFDAWLVELDKISHQIVWQTTLGGAQTEFINDLKVFDDGSFLIGGSTFSDNGDIEFNKGISDIWVVKFDKLKTRLWSKTYGENRFESLNSIKIKENGNLILAGETESNTNSIKGNNGGLDILLLEISKDGNILNQTCLGTADNEENTDIIYENNTLFITGISFSADWDKVGSISAQNILYASINDDFTAPEKQTFGGSQSEWPLKMLRKNNKTYILNTTASNSGDIVSNNGDYDFWVFDITGNSIGLQKNFGGSIADQASHILPIDGGFIIAGSTESNDGDVLHNNGMVDIWIIKTDENFNLIKQMNFGGSYNDLLMDLKYDGTTITLFGTTMSNDFGIGPFHGKEGSNTDIWIVKYPF